MGDRGRWRWRRRGDKQGGEEQEATMTHGSIRMKRTWCGELETTTWQGKDAFIFASSSCAVVASPPFSGATASPQRYRLLLSSLPSRCLLPSPTSPPLPATSFCRRCYLPALSPSTLSDPLIFVHTAVATRGLSVGSGRDL